MPEMKKERDQLGKHWKTLLLYGVLYNNPVLIGALGMCPVIAAGYTLKNGVTLSLILAVLMIPTCVVSSLLFRRVARWIRIPLIVLLSSVLYGGAYWAVRYFLPGMPDALGLYGPLMIVNSVIISRADDFSTKHCVSFAAVNAVACSAGFALVICIASAVREIFAYGTIGGYVLLESYHEIPAVAMPFFGFIVLGYLGALFKGFRNKKQERKHTKSSQERGAER